MNIFVFASCYRHHEGLLSTNIKTKIQRFIILPVGLYGCESGSFTLREGHRLRLFEKSVNRGVFGPKMGDVIGESTRLDNMRLYGLYFSSNIA
jgi:hypothetical protein